MVARKQNHGTSRLAEGVRHLYTTGQTDYSLDPILLTMEGEPSGRIKDHDSVIFCCRRGEREIELTEAFTDPYFSHFPRASFQDLNFTVLTLYHEKFKDLPVAFAPARIKNTLGETVAKAGLRQLRVAESEKFAHVTFFLNGGNNQPFDLEDDQKVPTRKGVAFDQIPELSLDQVAASIKQGLSAGYDLIVTNFANGDVIGHTSNQAAKIKCAAIVDHYLGEVIASAVANGYMVLVTADHGNLEEMLTPEGLPHVAHTTNRVPFVLVNKGNQNPIVLREGRLADIAPTILSALNLPLPETMTGQNLISTPDGTTGQRILLVILDGWGTGRQDDSNPIHLADTPVWDGLLSNHPNCQLEASGEAVGLQAGKAGNSEAGHMNIGAGRVIWQDDVRLDAAMQDGTFYNNEVLCHAINRTKEIHSSLHLIGLLTEKSSHGSIAYPLAILKMAKANGLENAFVHLIFDGRSTEPGSAPALLEKLEVEMAKIGIGSVVTGVGRGYALDRDGNYGKIKKAYDALVFGKGHTLPW